MKTLQLQRKILNGIGKKNPDYYFYSENKDWDMVTITDGYVAWTLEEKEVLINLDRLKERDLNDFLNVKSKDAEILEIKEYFRKPNEKKEYVRLQGRDKDIGEIYIDSKHLEFFENFELLGSGPKGPVFVAERERQDIAGLIMPILMKGEYYD